MGNTINAHLMISAHWIGSKIITSQAVTLLTASLSSTLTRRFVYKHWVLKEKGLALQLDMEFNTVKKLWPQISEPAVSIPESYTLCVWSGEELKQTSLEGESLDSSPEKDTFITPAPSPRGSSASAS